MAVMKKDVTEAPVDEAFYKTLLESTKAIPWRIDWATMEISYIGPEIEELLGLAQDSWVSVSDWSTIEYSYICMQIGELTGWAQDSWESVDDWAHRMHPEDREKTVS